jgi:general secretion pathway protein J
VRRRAATRALRGFTLLEVLIAITLFMLLMTLLYAGMNTAVRAYGAGELRTESGAQLRVVSEFLRRSLSGAFAMAVAQPPDWVLLFDGGDGRVRYVADLPGYVGIGGLHEIVVEDASGEQGRQLVMRRRPLVIAEDGSIHGAFEDRVLLHAFKGLEVRFFGSDDAREAPSWRAQWPQGKSMPLLVELRIRDPDGQPWPPVIVRPQADAMRYQGAGALVPGTPQPQVPAGAAGGADSPVQAPPAPVAVPSR